MKIAIPARGFNSHGGISRCIWELSKAYSAHHDVHVFSSNFEGSCGFITPHPIFSLPSPPFLAELSFAIGSQNALSSFSGIVHAPATSCYKADVFTAHSCHRAAVGLFKKQRGFAYSALKGFEPKSSVVMEIEKYNYAKGHYKKITAVSSSTKNELMQYYNVPEEDIIVVPNGVDANAFRPDMQKKEEMRKKYSVPEGVPLLVFCGHEFRRKGLSQAILALAHAKGDFRLLAIGGGDAGPCLRLAKACGISGKIIFAGFVQSAEEHFSAGDAFVFPTAYEPFGMAILEALSSGMPVVTSQTAGAAELMAHGKEGFLLKDPFDAKELAGYLDTLLSDPSLRKKMGESARKTALNYTWEKISRKMIGVLEGIS